MKCIFNKDSGQIYGFLNPDIQDLTVFCNNLTNYDVIDVPAEQVKFTKNMPRMYVDLETRTLVIITK
jgi:hypothetical protein